MMLFGMTYYQIFWYFILYSFIGWMVEVAFHALTLGKIINRGFLNGPLCPVYGFGMLSVLAVCNSLETSGLLTVRSGTTDGLSTFALFLVGMIMATLVELIAGWLLDIAFHTRWWDYSGKPLNLHGYICLEFSILWGIGITMIVRIIHPIIESSGDGFQQLLPERYGRYVLLVIYCMVAADCIITVLTVIGLNKKLKQIDEMRSSMRIFSDNLSEAIGTNTIKTAQVIQEGEVQMALAKAELRSITEPQTEKLYTDAAVFKAGIAEGMAVIKSNMQEDGSYDITGVQDGVATVIQDSMAAGKTLVQDSMAVGKTVMQTGMSAGKTAVQTGVSSGKTAVMDGMAQTKAKLQESTERSKEALSAQTEALRAQSDALKASFKKHTLMSGRRLMRAFPQMKNRDYEKLLDEIKKDL